MSTFDPQKLSVRFIPPATTVQPVVGRKYTLTHSDTTAELFLGVGYVYDYAAIDPKMRDEVIAEWVNDNGQSVLFGKAYVSGGEFDKKVSYIRFTIFQREMDTALQGMIYGDRQFFAHYPVWLDAPIYIYFQSVYPEYNGIGYYGTPRKYLRAASSYSAV